MFTVLGGHPVAKSDLTVEFLGEPPHSLQAAHGEPRSNSQVIE